MKKNLFNVVSILLFILGIVLMNLSTVPAKCGPGSVVEDPVLKISGLVLIVVAFSIMIAQNFLYLKKK